MQIQVRYFQSIRKLTGLENESIELPDEATVASLLESLIGKYPDLQAAAPSLMFAVNANHASLTTELTDGATVALMPPFSGG